MDTPKLFDHMEIRPITVVKRKKPNFAPRGKIRSFDTHGAFLATAASRIATVLTDRMKATGSKTGYITLRTFSPISEQALKQVGLTPVEYKGRNTIVVATEDPELFRFRSKLVDFRKGIPVGKEVAPLEGVFGNIQEVSVRTPEEKLGAALRYLTIAARDLYKVDIKVLPAIDGAERGRRFHQLRTTMQRYRGRVMDEDRSQFILRVELRGQGLTSLLEAWDDIEVDGVPILKTSVQHLESFVVSRLQLRDPDDEMTGICLIDSGIDDNHPCLARVVKTHRSFHDGAEGIEDRSGHGTRVAGIAAYGDVQQCIKTHDFQPTAWLYSAKILEPDDDGDDTMDNELLSKKLRRIVEYYKDECRVFNLSVGLPHSFNGTDIPDWVAEVDKLSREYDVLFVTCTGNLTAGEVANQLKNGNRYPGYLSLPESRLFPPGQAAVALCVGSIAHDGQLHVNGKGRTVLAGVMQPSPFSRPGLGLNEAVKPDLCEIGGNMFVDSSGVVSSDDPRMGVPTTTTGNGGLFTTAAGTSFAVPKVSNLAARIFNQFKGRSADLVRALIVNSAVFPAVKIDRKAAAELAKHYGYGVPKVDRALHSTADRVTFIYEGKVTPDTCEVFSIPLPDELMSGAGRKTVSITLAYAPEVDPLKGVAYQGTELEWRLAKKGTTLERVVRQLDAELEETSSAADKNGALWWSGSLFGSRMRSKGTVQKDVFTWIRGTQADALYFAVVARKRWGPIETPQPFALVVTLECEDNSIDIYTPIRARSRARQRVKLTAKHS